MIRKEWLHCLLCPKCSLRTKRQEDWLGFSSEVSAKQQKRSAFFGLLAFCSEWICLMGRWKEAYFTRGGLVLQSWSTGCEFPCSLLTNKPVHCLTALMETLKRGWWNIEAVPPGKVWDQNSGPHSALIWVTHFCLPMCQGPDQKQLPS